MPRAHPLDRLFHAAERCAEQARWHPQPDFGIYLLRHLYPTPFPSPPDHLIPSPRSEPGWHCQHADGACHTPTPRRTVEDLRLNISLTGACIAGVSVVSSGLQQIFVRSLQQKHGLSSHELLSNTAPAQAWTLLAVGPFVDKVVSGGWVFNYPLSQGATLWLAGSCILAVLVNITQFMCLGRFSAVSFQVCMFMGVKG